MAVDQQPPSTVFPEAGIGINVGLFVAFPAQNKQRALGLRQFFVGLTRFFVAFAKLSVKESYKKFRSCPPNDVFSCFLR